MTKKASLESIRELVSEYPDLSDAVEALNKRNIHNSKGKEWTVKSLRGYVAWSKRKAAQADPEKAESLAPIEQKTPADKGSESKSDKSAPVSSPTRSTAEDEQLPMTEVIDASERSQGEVNNTSAINLTISDESGKEKVADTSVAPPSMPPNNGSEEVSNTESFSIADLNSLRKLIELERSGDLDSLVDWYRNTLDTSALVAAARPNLRGPRSNTGIKVNSELLRLARTKQKAGKWRSLNQIIENLLWQFVGSPSDLLE